MNTKEILFKENGKAKVFLTFKMEIHTEVNLKMDICMGKENISILMDNIFKAIS